MNINQLLLKYLRPLSWLLWGMLAVGMVDHIFLKPRGMAIIPEAVFGWMMIALWPLLLAVWFGWKESERQKANRNNGQTPEG